MQSLKLLHRKFASVCLFLSVTNQQKMDVLLIFLLFGCSQNRWDIVCKSQRTGVGHHKFVFDPPLPSQYTAPCSWIEHLDIHTISYFYTIHEVVIIGCSRTSYDLISHFLRQVFSHDIPRHPTGAQYQYLPNSPLPNRSQVEPAYRSGSAYPPARQW